MSCEGIEVCSGLGWVGKEKWVLKYWVVLAFLIFVFWISVNEGEGERI